MSLGSYRIAGVQCRLTSAGIHPASLEVKTGKSAFGSSCTNGVAHIPLWLFTQIPPTQRSPGHGIVFRLKIKLRSSQIGTRVERCESAVPFLIYSCSNTVTTPKRIWSNLIWKVGWTRRFSFLCGWKGEWFYYTCSSSTVPPLYYRLLISSNLLHRQQTVVTVATCGLGPGSACLVHKENRLGRVDQEFSTDLHYWNLDLFVAQLTNSFTLIHHWRATTSL